MLIVRGIVDSTSEHIEHASVNMPTSQNSQPVIHILRLLIFEVVNQINSYFMQIPGNAAPYSRDRFQTIFLIFIFFHRTTVLSRTTVKFMKTFILVKYSIIHHILFTELTYFVPIIKADELIDTSLC